MTDNMRAQSRKEIDAIGHNLGALRHCKTEAEQGREFGISPPLPSDVVWKGVFGRLI